VCSSVPGIGPEFGRPDVRDSEVVHCRAPSAPPTPEYISMMILRAMRGAAFHKVPAATP
jgi:hypothetical protein